MSEKKKEAPVKSKKLTREQRKAIAKAAHFPYWTIVYGASALFLFTWLLQYFRS